MYESVYDPDQRTTKCVGSFSYSGDSDYKASLKATYENFRNSYQIDPLKNMHTILSNEAMYSEFKDQMFGDIIGTATESVGVGTGYGRFKSEDEYVAMHAQKFEQLVENNRKQLVQEAANTGMLEPIVGLTMPLLKKEYIANQFKDMLQVVVSPSPIVRYAYERRFIKDEAGNKKYFPECFYDGSYAEFTDKSIGKPISDKWYPEAGKTFPLVDLDMLEESGGSLAKRDALGYDFCVNAIKVKVPSDDASGYEEVIADGLNIMPDYSNKSFSYTLEIPSKKAAVVEPTKVYLFGMVDMYNGKVTITSNTADKTTAQVLGIQFGGHLSNSNNDAIIELDKERHNRQITISEKERINTGLTLERIKDEKALANIDVTVELVSDMSDVCAQTADSNIQRFLENSFNKTKTIQQSRIFKPMGYDFKFVDEWEFDLSAPSTYMVPESEWRSKQLRYYFGRMISFIKAKLRDERVMIVVSANAYCVELLSATEGGVRWVLNNDTNIGGVKLDYKFGVTTIDGTRVHIIATQKETISKGFRIVVIPLTDTVITYRKYDYSFNIETNYRNPLTPNIPNIMCVQRYEMIEVLPVQSNLYIKQYREGNLAMTPSSTYGGVVQVPVTNP